MDFYSPVLNTYDPADAAWYPVTQSASGTRQIRGAIVAAGTSRAIILSGEGLQGINPEEAVKALMKGHRTQGLMDSHYQGNKVAVIWPAQFPSGFIFQFFQYDKATESVLSAMECSNVAASCAAYALLTGMAEPDENHSIHGFNEQTGQHIMLTPTDLANPSWCPWVVRFVEHNPEPNFYPYDNSLTYREDDRETEFWAFEKGNAFVFALTDPTTASEPLIQALADKGGERIVAQGGDTQKAKALKIILYTIDDINDGVIKMNVACRFLGEQHKSLPGSAAMALAGFLTQNDLLANYPDEPYGTYRFQMKHPSGYLEVQAHWAVTDSGVQILATEFITPTAVLLDGGFFINGDAHAAQ
jgi:hypothetical protein